MKVPYNNYVLNIDGKGRMLWFNKMKEMVDGSNWILDGNTITETWYGKQVGDIGQERITYIKKNDEYYFFGITRIVSRNGHVTIHEKIKNCL